MTKWGRALIALGIIYLVVLGLWVVIEYQTATVAVKRYPDLPYDMAQNPFVGRSFGKPDLHLAWELSILGFILIAVGVCLLIFARRAATVKLFKDRRVIFGVGAALLVGGWGLTLYAHEQQQSIPVVRTDRIDAWISDRGKPWEKYQVPADRVNAWKYGWYGLLASKTIYAWGVVGMALGAGLIGFSVLRKSESP